MKKCKITVLKRNFDEELADNWAICFSNSAPFVFAKLYLYLILEYYVYMKKIFKIIFSILFLCVISFYLGIIYVLPSVISNKTTIHKLQSLIYKKTGINTAVTGFNLKISPKFKVILKIDSLDAKNNDVSVIDIKNFTFGCELLSKHPALISANKIFIDFTHDYAYEGRIDRMLSTQGIRCRFVAYPHSTSKDRVKYFINRY